MRKGKDMAKFVTTAAVFLAAALVIGFRPCLAKSSTAKPGVNKPSADKPDPASEKVHVYKSGFTYQKLTDEIVERIEGKSYQEDAKIKLDSLRYLRIQYVDFKGNVRSGEMIVNKKIARRTLKVFYRLYQIGYPIQRMRLVDEYGADDEASMAANNTSAFNYRKIAGTDKLSNHSRGLAIDINPKINPYITSKGVAPSNGRRYKEREVSKCRGKYRDYMIHKGDDVYKIFKKYGFSWGGNWKHAKDYQHFEYV